jgi:mono/diheme cytochrome c family protein
VGPNVKRAARWSGVTLLVLCALVMTAALVVYVLSTRRLQRVHPVTVVVPRTIPADPAAVARGKHVAGAMGSCTLCHGQDLGGQMLWDDGPMGTLAAPNLTSGKGGLGATFTDTDWVRGIRHGVHRDGTTLLIMPCEAFVHMNERDLGDLIAYLKQLPPVDREMPRVHLSPIGRTLLVLGKFSVLIAEKTPRLPYPAVVEPGPTAAYGRYLANFTGCHGCHGFGLSGGRVAGPPDEPPASNLTPDPATGIGHWTQDDFARALRQGVRPDGRAIDTFMPWPYFAGLTDDEVTALWLHVRSVPPRPFGNK